MKWKLKYQVVGVWSFPVDMLRYDRAYPDTETDSGKILRSIEGRVVREEYPNAQNAEEPITISLLSYCARKSELPTERRWQSFGWEVVPNSITWEKL